MADQAQLLAARAHLAAGDVTRAEALLDDVEARFRKMFPPGHSAFAAVAIDRVRIPMARGRLDDALRVANDAVSLVESTPRYRGSIPFALRRRAEVLIRLRRFADARIDAERLVAIVDPAHDTGPSALVGNAYLTLAEALHGEGRDAEARAALNEALRHLEAAAGPDAPGTVRAKALLQLNR